MPYFLGLVFLSAFRGTSAGAPLLTALIFAVMGLFAIFASLAAHSAGIRPFKWWHGKFDKKDLKYIGGAYAGLLVMAFVVSGLISGSAGILIALSGGAVVLFYSLIKSETILVPWLVHFAYNLTAITLASFSIISLSTSPFYVPNFTLDGIRPADFASQAFMQFFFVALSEEILKISVALGLFFFTKSKKVALGLSAAAWVALHTILSYPISLPF